MSEETNSFVEQARSGDRAALERLLISHSDQLTSHIARGLPKRVWPRVAVEDVVQETLTQAFLKKQKKLKWTRPTENRQIK